MRMTVVKRRRGQAPTLQAYVVPCGLRSCSNCAKILDKPEGKVSLPLMLIDRWMLFVPLPILPRRKMLQNFPFGFATFTIP